MNLLIWVILSFQFLVSLVMTHGHGASSAQKNYGVSLNESGAGCIYIYIAAASPNEVFFLSFQSECSN